eukprot:Opistho-2@72844
MGSSSSDDPTSFIKPYSRERTHSQGLRVEAEDAITSSSDRRQSQGRPSFSRDAPVRVRHKDEASILKDAVLWDADVVIGCILFDAVSNPSSMVPSNADLAEEEVDADVLHYAWNDPLVPAAAGRFMSGVRTALTATKIAINNSDARKMFARVIEFIIAIAIFTIASLWGARLGLRVLVWLLSLVGIGPAIVDDGESDILGFGVSVLPFLSVLFLRYIFYSPLDLMFLAVLRDPKLGPGGSRLASSLQKRDFRGMTSYAMDALLRYARYFALASTVFIVGRIPFVGGLALGLIELMMFKRTFGWRIALLIAGVTAIPFTRPLVMGLLETWFAARALGRELIEPYGGRAFRGVFGSGRTAFMKTHGAAIVGFALPFALLLRVPVAGPLFFVVAQAAAPTLVLSLLIAEEQSVAPGAAKAK